jgi:PAS domain S-box-containing protein
MAGEEEVMREVREGLSGSIPQGGTSPGALPDGIALQILSRAPFAIVLTDPTLEDNAIVYVNDAFERATGYARFAAIGRNCRFLQGAETDPRAVEKLRQGIREEEEVAVDILNYRADGSPFWNRLMIAPLYAPSGELQYFLGIQKVLGRSPLDEDLEDPDVALREIQHRVKNHLSMIVSMIRLQSRNLEATEHFETLARRVESLQLLYDELSHGKGENRDAVALGAYLSRVANAIAYLDGRGGVRVKVDVDAFTVPMETAVRVGLITSEVLTNALQHAFEGREEGLLQTHVHETPGGGIRLQVIDDGIGLPAGVDLAAGAGLGSRLVSSLARTLGAELRVDSGSSGTTVTLDIPRSARGPY